jgi:hypothetical protein
VTVGDFEANRFHGYGEFTHTDGRVHKDFWNAGSPLDFERFIGQGAFGSLELNEKVRFI